jgi:predicted DNA-binding transcriptional regulator YafY
MSRIERLLELTIKMQHRTRFTAQELADEMGVSRRTMLRDLQALQLMGVPLFATSGPRNALWATAAGRRWVWCAALDHPCHGDRLFRHVPVAT